MHTRYAYIPTTTIVALTRATIGVDASAIFTPPYFLKHFVNQCFTDTVRQQYWVHLLWNATSLRSHSVVPFRFMWTGMYYSI